MGSHLVDRLMRDGHEVGVVNRGGSHDPTVKSHDLHSYLQVTVVDNFFTGRKKNLEHW